MGNSASASLLADELVSLALKSDLGVYAAFKATERRLVFVYGDQFKAKPRLHTILPTGDVEGPREGKVLDPKKEKGLIMFPFVQYLDSSKAERHSKTDFVWRTSGDEYALAHMWTVNYNDDFRKSFVESDENPDTQLFDPQAVENFYIAVCRLFGDEARQVKIKYCTKVTQNVERTFVGTPSKIKKFLEAKGVKESLGIQKVDGNEIHVNTKDKKGNIGTKTFNLGDADDVEQVLYKRVGHTSFMCLKPLTLFETDSVLQGQITN